MGVTGLWRLIEPAGKPVPVENLENKILAVDISIWLHQMVKGYQDAKGAPLPNAHLMGLFQRLCKLLYFRIKPVFVFDGGFPDLKRDTIAKRQDHKLKYNSESERLKRELALLLSKKTAISSLLGKQISPKKGVRSEIQSDDDLFKLPALPERENETESESEDDQETSSGSIVDLHSVDIESDNFKNLPTKEKYDLLVELKETRKMNSWGKLHELPKKSDNFSDFQMQRLLKRRKVQECLEETEKEMGDTGMSLNDLESFLNEEGIDTKIDNLPTRRIASNDTTRFLLINDVKKTLANIKKAKELENKASTSEKEDNAVDEKLIKKDEFEDDLQKAIQMSLDCADEPNTSANTSKTEESLTSFLTDTDSEEEDGFEQSEMTSAKAYIMQYSDFTHSVIDDIVTSRSNDKNKSKVPKVNKVIEELNKEKSIIVDKIDLSSDEGNIHSNSNIHNKMIDNESDTDLKTISSESENFKNSIDNVNMDTDELSVVCINNTVQNVTLDTKTDDDLKISETNLFEANENKNESDSSDDDFEEVSEEENKPSKPVVQLMLNMGSAPEDDIFADIFTDKEQSIPNNNVNVDSAVFIKDAKSTEAKTLNKISGNQENNEDSAQMKLQKENVAKSNGNLTKIEIIKAALSNIDDGNNSHPNNESEKSVSVIKDNTVIEVNKEIENHKEVISTETLNTMVEDIQDEERNLLHEKGRLERVGRNITEQMTKEAQELLQMFGIPYIVAPMEAEAQCAFLESVKLTDGTITDDSDIWLFGGRTVYKNFFNQKKHVLQFLSERIEKSFNLTREQLILLALLVGSDYTTGVTGVGPVTALEILASFPFNKRKVSAENSEQTRYSEIVAGLVEFKKWIHAGKITDNTTLKKKLKNVNLTDDFPSARVVQAYLVPNVEKSEENFTWGQIDITILRDYTKAKFGWSQNKLDEIIKPVLKRMLECRTQKTVDDYFKKKIDFQSLENQMSKRVRAAVQKMGPEGLQQEVSPETNKEISKKRSNKNSKTGAEYSKASNAEAGPSKIKRKKKNGDESLLIDHGVKIVSETDAEGKTKIEINIPKTDRYQEMIPQREKHKQNILDNKLKAIEMFRKTKIDCRRKVKRKVKRIPKEKAELSESSDSA